MRMIGLIRWTLVYLPLTIVHVAIAQWDEEEPDCFAEPTGKALKLLEKGQNGSKYDRSERTEFLEEAFDLDEQCMACLFEWGRLEFNAIKRSNGSFQPARHPLSLLVDQCPEYRADAFYMLGAMAYADRDYQSALDYFEEYQRFPAGSEEVLGKRRSQQLKEVEEVMPLIQFYLDFWQYDGKYEPAPVPPVSQQTDEFLPALSPDGSMLFFTRRVRHKAKGDVVTTELELFHVAERRKEQPFDGGTPLESPFNAGARYGGASISVDNRELFIAAANPTPKNPDNIDIYVTRYEIVDRDETGDFFYVWDALEPVDALNTMEGWEAQPALSADGHELFFAGVNASSSKDANGNATMDIYRSIRDNDGNWSAPSPLPSPINSTFNDKAPFLHPDGNTLYFSSDRQPGGGGYDIWMCQRDEFNRWGEAKNFGSPLNTAGDEHGLVVSTNGQEAFFAGRREGTQAMDIMRFEMPEAFRPENVFIMQGSLEGANGEVPEGARLYLQYAQSKDVQEIAFDEVDGHFASVVRAREGDDVLLVAEADGIAFETQVVFDHETMGAGALPDTHVADVMLEQSKDGEAFEIGDIQFATNSAAINRTSQLMLELFADYLLRNEAIEVHIKGHTDNRGQEAENQLLSEQRAAAVATSLAAHGVPEDRVTSAGFGQSRPIASNDTEAGRSKNRRTEFEIRLKN